ncbi:MAG: lysine--tRNA ligase [Candidatus Pacebacteria bacterium]|nr:lysine--tRNA ligase [Candidatus Paceibacterota bacterium]
MSSIEDIRKARIKKLKAIEAAGFSAYPNQVKRTHTSETALKEFSKLFRQKKEVILVGRIISLREHGGLAFINIKDESGKIQAMLKKDRLGEKGYRFFLDNFDIGDFIEIKGILFKTKRGEKTIEVWSYKMTAKSLLPLPEKWHGLTDIEERYRKRHLDLLFNPEVKERFVLRSKVITEIRSFLEKEGFLEVETPILQPLYGGASAKPFKTHLNALDINLYLRISPELYLKRLLVGGFEKVYEIGKCFRNEGIDKAHNPDFTMLEFYWAYSDYKELMKFTEKFISSIIKKITGRTKISYQGKTIDFSCPWPRIEYSNIIRKYAKIDIDEMGLEGLKKQAQKMGLSVKGGKAEIIDEIYKKMCRPKISNPVFLIQYPASAFPLAKPLDDNTAKSASFQLVAAGFELVKAFSEMNNPILQRERFKEQEKIFKQGFEEAQPMDEDFIEALEYGMPPASGFGMGIDRLTALITNSHSLREIILFPIMKPR